MTTEATNHAWDSLAIPSFAGSGPVTGRYQRRTQLQYASLFALGLLGFYKSTNSRIRIAGLSCLFPGAGFLAVGGFVGVLGLVLSVAILPLSIFAWFGAGGLAFVLANWIVPAVIAVSIAGDSVWEPAGPIIVAASLALCVFVYLGGRKRHAKALALRGKRNEVLEKEDAAWKARAEPRAAKDLKRELSLEDLRRFQFFVQVAHQADDDWANFTRIDQFQTSALRYQLYGLQWTMAQIQKYYMPNFAGYLKEGQEKLIEKSTTQDVMNYWKWESLWGKFTLDWDPAVRDNIMVTGYIMLCVALYEKLTGDDRYSKKDALNFRITKGAQYLHNSETIFESLMMNWESCSYCLYPCEPNWIYTICNSVGMQGALAYEALRKTGRVTPLLQGDFTSQWEKDFLNADGSVVALRSAITGFPIVGIAGVIGDVEAAYNCAAAMPNFARRLWLISREEHVRKNEKGKYTLTNLVGADKIDVGNYKANPGYAFAAFAKCAAEFGEMDICRDLLEELEKDYPTATYPRDHGAVKTEGLSLLGQMVIFRARVTKPYDFSDMIIAEPDEAALAAPKLDEVPFPKVMVARCHAEGKTGVSFVLCASGPVGEYKIGFKDLNTRRTYEILRYGDQGKKTPVVSGIRPDGDGVAKVKVEVGERTEFELKVST